MFSPDLSSAPSRGSNAPAGLEGPEGRITRREAVRRIGAILGFLMCPSVPESAAAATGAAGEAAALNLNALLKIYPALRSFSSFLSNLLSDFHRLPSCTAESLRSSYTGETAFNCSVFTLASNMGNPDAAMTLPSLESMNLAGFDRYLRFFTPCADAFRPDDLRRASYLARKDPSDKWFVQSELGRDISDDEHAMWQSWFKKRIDNFNAFCANSGAQSLADDDLQEALGPAPSENLRILFADPESRRWRMFDNMSSDLMELNCTRHEFDTFITLAGQAFPESDGANLLRALRQKGFDHVVVSSEFGLRKRFWQLKRELDFSFANNNAGALERELEDVRIEMRRAGIRPPDRPDAFSLVPAPLDTWIAAHSPGRLVLHAADPQEASCAGWFEDAGGLIHRLRDDHLAVIRRMIPPDVLERQSFARQVLFVDRCDANDVNAALMARLISTEIAPDNHAPVTMRAQDQAAQYLDGWKRRNAQRTDGVVTVEGLDIFVPARIFSPDPQLTNSSRQMVCHMPREIEGEVLDLGTGSGVLAVHAALRGGKVTATDFDPLCLSTARENARRHSIGHRISFIESDLFESVNGTYKLILANLPIADSAWDGLYRSVELQMQRFFSALPDFLSPGGKCMVPFASFGDEAQFRRIISGQSLRWSEQKESRFGVDWSVFILEKN